MSAGLVFAYIIESFSAELLFLEQVTRLCHKQQLQEVTLDSLNVILGSGVVFEQTVSVPSIFAVGVGLTVIFPLALTAGLYNLRLS